MNGYGPGKHAPVALALSLSTRLDDLHRCLPTSAVLWFSNKIRNIIRDICPGSSCKIHSFTVRHANTLSKFYAFLLKPRKSRSPIASSILKRVLVVLFICLFTRAYKSRPECRHFVLKNRLLKFWHTDCQLTSLEWRTFKFCLYTHCRHFPPSYTMCSKFLFLYSVSYVYWSYFCSHHGK